MMIEGGYGDADVPCTFIIANDTDDPRGFPLASLASFTTTFLFFNYPALFYPTPMPSFMLSHAVIVKKGCRYGNNSLVFTLAKSCMTPTILGAILPSASFETTTSSLYLWHSIFYASTFGSSS